MTKGRPSSLPCLVLVVCEVCVLRHPTSLSRKQSRMGATHWVVCVPNRVVSAPSLLPLAPHSMRGVVRVTTVTEQEDYVNRLWNKRCRKTTPQSRQRKTTPEGGYSASRSAHSHSSARIKCGISWRNTGRFPVSISDIIDLLSLRHSLGQVFCNRSINSSSDSSNCSLRCLIRLGYLGTLHAPYMDNVIYHAFGMEYNNPRFPCGNSDKFFSTFDVG